jgi:hypothetical protein
MILNHFFCLKRWILLCSILILGIALSVRAQYYSPVEKDYTFFQVNNINAWITDYGSLYRNPITGDSGFEWPAGSNNYAIFASGLWMGAQVEEQPRVAIAEYSHEFAPGTIDQTTHLPNDPADSSFRIYKIQKGITSNWDYRNWPAQYGAPLDKQGDPLFIGDQTLWTVFNDADSAQHVNMGGFPLGVEIQQTVFGFYLPQSQLGNVIFVRWLIINKGGRYLDSAYVAIWSDPDLGDVGDDLVGCDSSSSLCFCYNGSDFDEEYGDHPPAVGYLLLQGPVVASSGDTAIFMGHKMSDHKNLPMTSFIFWNSNNAKNGFPKTPQDVYYYMQARWRDGTHVTYGDFGTNLLNPPTNYMFSGDPEAGTGWLDSQPSDRRLFLSSGPFDMVPGDSQEVVFATLITRGASNLNSVTQLKNVAKTIQEYYNIELYKSLRSYNKPAGLTLGDRIGLFQNYPNPFNSRTTIKYQLPIARTVRLEIFNAAGQRVATLVNEPQEPDEYEVVWDASGLASGIYFARLRVAQYVFTKKLLLLK